MPNIIKQHGVMCIRLELVAKTREVTENAPLVRLSFGVPGLAKAVQ